MKYTKSFLDICLILGITLFLVFIFYCNLFNYNSYMNSDIASEVLLAREIATTHQWIPETWIRSSETRVIAMPQVSALFYLITNNMVLSSGIACCVISVLVVFSILYFGYSIKLGRTSSLLLIFLCLCLVANENMASLFFLRACYYSFHVIALFLALATISRIYSGRSFWGSLVISYLLSFLLGLQGMRGILNIYGPLIVLLIFAGLVYCYKKIKPDKKELIIAINIVGLFITSFIATLFPLSVGQSMSRNIRNGFGKLFSEVLGDISIAVGFKDTIIAYKLCVIILSVLSIIAVVILITRIIRKDVVLSFVDWGYVFVWISPVMTVFFLAFTTFNSCDRYFYIFVYTLALSPIYIMHFINKKIIMYLMVVFSLVISVVSYYNCYRSQLFEKEGNITSNEVELLDYMMQKDVERAYSNFYNANRLTVLYNGQVNIAPIGEINTMSIYEWLSSTRWYPPYVNRDSVTAYIATSDQLELNNYMNDKDEFLIDYAVIGRYSVYILNKNLTNNDM